MLKRIRFKSAYGKELSGKKSDDKVIERLREMIRTAGPIAWVQLLRILQDGKTKTAIKVDIIKFIIEHNIGKPRQGIDIDAEVRSALLIEVRRVTDIAEIAIKPALAFQELQEGIVAQDIMCDPLTEIAMARDINSCPVYLEKETCVGCPGCDKENRIE